jgi:hypothetical protein
MSNIPGVLGLREATATNIVNAMMAGGYLATIPAAVVADTWLGRYRTILISAMYDPRLVAPIVIKLMIRQHRTLWFGDFVRDLLFSRRSSRYRGRWIGYCHCAHRCRLRRRAIIRGSIYRYVLS